MTNDTIAADTLTGFARNILVAAGMREPHAQIVSDTLVYAELRGVSSHGLARLPSYLDRVAAGAMELDPDMTVDGSFDAFRLLDAQNGFGQIAACTAMDAAAAMARRHGIGAVSVRNSNHFGVAAYFVERAARAGLVGIALTNASPAMAPYNARTALIGTNPIAFGIPAGAQRPIVLDMSTSLVARGKIRLAAMNGDAIPLGWAVDADGVPTTDAKAALDGHVAPMGGPKGAGLSLVIDILTGVLSATALTGAVRNITDLGGPSRTGHLLLALEPAAIGGAQSFARDVAAVADKIHALEPVPGAQIRLPGELEALAAERRAQEGIPLSPAVIAALQATAARYGVPPLALAA